MLAALCLIALVSCTQELGGGKLPEGNDTELSSKLVFSSKSAVGGELLVCFDGESVNRIEGYVRTRSAEDAVVTRSGLTSVDAVLEEIGVCSLERLFPADARNEERTRAAGLHQWYIVKFDESVDLDVAARKLALVSDVSKVQFNQKMKRIGSTKAVVPEDIPDTKASGYDFNDRFLGRQWHYINTGDKSLYTGIKAGADVNCKDAWPLCTGDPRVVVAIVDGGVQADHPDLAANMWRNEKELNGQPGVDDDGNGYVDDFYGYDFVHNQALTTPDAHGTHVAGTVAAVNNNGIGVCGVAGGSGNNDGVKLMSCQIFSGDDGGESAITARAIKYAADNGAAIIQCSYGYNAGAITSDDAYSRYVSAERQAIEYFMACKNCDAVDGGLVIFAAGNETTGMASYPGAYKDYICVTSMSCDYTPAYYTNYGPGCNVAAPGGDAYQSMFTNQGEAAQVYSTVPEGKYGYMQGTSMACPHMSGVAALGLSYALKIGKKFTRNEFNSILLTSVNNIDQYCTGSKRYYDDNGILQTLNLSNYKKTMGVGYIDAYQVLMNVRGTLCIPVPIGSRQTIDFSEIIGGGDTNFQISSVSISAEDKEKIGLLSNPVKSGNKIYLTCTKVGSAMLTVTFTAGTSSGTGISGMAIEREYALIARENHGENGGWL